jgi:outer membrane protein TolC
MRWFHLNLIISILSISTAVGGASEQGELTLSEAVATALANSPAVESAQAKVDAASARSRQAKGFRLPSVDLMQSFSYTDNPAEAFALQLNQKRFDMMEFFGSDPNNPDFLETWMTRLEVTQPLYVGGKLSARIEQAGAMASAEELSLQHAREQAAFDTTSAYINLAKAREMLALAERSRLTTAEHVKLAEQYAGQGFIVEAEVLNARVFLAQMDEMLAQAGNGVELAGAALSFEMGVDQSLKHQLAPLSKPVSPSGNLDEWIVAALERRADLNAARRQLDAGRLEVEVAKSAFKPEVAVVGRFELYDDTPFGSNGTSTSLMAVGRINLFRGYSDRAALAAAKFQTDSYSSDVERFEAGIRLEVRQAWQEIVTARTRHSTASASLDAAQEALRVREHRFKQGLDKMIDLLDAETALHDAQVRELMARYDLILAHARLRFVSGASLIDTFQSSSK